MSEHLLLQLTNEAELYRATLHSVEGLAVVVLSSSVCVFVDRACSE